MTREEALALARDIDEARGVPELSTERHLRELFADMDGRGRHGVPAYHARELPRLLESWKNVPGGEGSALFGALRGLGEA